jgi:predicted nucleic acid-binding protein
MRYLLDTNVISERIAKQPSPQVTDGLDRLDDSQVYLSVLTMGEIKRGLKSCQLRNERNGFVSGCKTICLIDSVIAF